MAITTVVGLIIGIVAFAWYVYNDMKKRRESGFGGMKVGGI